MAAFIPNTRTSLELYEMMECNSNALTPTEIAAMLKARLALAVFNREIRKLREAKEAEKSFGSNG